MKNKKAVSEIRIAKDALKTVLASACDLAPDELCVAVAGVGITQDAIKLNLYLPPTIYGIPIKVELVTQIKAQSKQKQNEI